MELVIGAVVVAFAIAQQVNRSLDDWTGVPASDAPKLQRWTEAQLFEPVSKWVEDAERAVVTADDSRKICYRRGCLSPALSRELCSVHLMEEPPRFAGGGFMVDGERVVYYTGRRDRA